MTDSGLMPGVTTVLQNTKLDTDGLQKWRDRVGDKEADNVVRRAIKRGNILHNDIENYLLDKNYQAVSPLFPQMKSFLETIEQVLLIEYPLRSRHGFAGSVDCLAKIDGEAVLLDWKTATKPKKTEWIRDYKIQAAAYRQAIEEMFDVEVSYAVVVIATETGKLQEFKITKHYLDKYWKEFYERLLRFQSQTNLPF